MSDSKGAHSCYTYSLDSTNIKINHPQYKLEIQLNQEAKADGQRMELSK